MENNEGKKGCCEGKENCEHGMSCCHGMGSCGHSMKKCCIMRKIIMIIILVVIFCLGAQWGEMRSEFRGNRFGFERGGMMNWGYGKLDTSDLQKGAGAVTVDVKKVTDGTAGVVTPKP
ncbi:MAG: hypothetical protein WC241_04740 [Candidatus Paceibacterota bacterium]|jgi:hypothetical protein